METSRYVSIICEPARNLACNTSPSQSFQRRRACSPSSHLQGYSSQEASLLAPPMAASSSGREAKRARLLSLGRGAQVSQSGTAKLLQAVADEGLPDAFSRPTQYRARKETCADATPYGKLVESLELPCNEGAVTVGVQNPFAMLRTCCATSSHFSALLRAKLACHKEPWRFIFYADGVSPADGLAKHDRRKLVAVYWSFAELGHGALCREEVWMVATVVRESVVRDLDGGLSRLFALLLKSAFFKPGGFDFARSGMTLGLGGESVMLFARWAILLADELALKEILLCKGHAGYKPCVLCSNVVLHALSRSRPLATDWSVTTACTDVSRFKLHTDESVRASMARLPEAKESVPAKDFAELQVVHGFSFNPHSLLLDQHLQIGVASCVMFDWMHVYCVGGLLDVELGQCMRALYDQRAPTTYHVLGAYVAQWKWPKALGASLLANLFDGKSAKKYLANEVFSCTASELLSLSPVLANYFANVALAQGACLEHVQSILAAFAAVECLVEVRRGTVTPEALMLVIRRHLQLYQLAYGADRVRPKHHYALHLPLMLHRFGTLHSCWTHERHHQLVKKHTVNRRNTTSYEVSALEEVTVDQIYALQRPWTKAGLLNEHAPPSRTLAALQEMFPHIAATELAVARMASVDGNKLHVGDVIYLRDNGIRRAGELVLHLRAGANVCSIVSLWGAAPSADEDLGRVARFRVTEAPQIFPTSCLEVSLIYSRSTRGVVTALIPPEFRGACP